LATQCRHSPSIGSRDLAIQSMAFSSLLKNPKNWAFVLSRVPLLG
jgi:hypothetical protein